jgi:hypothetical protein
VGRAEAHHGQGSAAQGNKREDGVNSLHGK